MPCTNRVPSRSGWAVAAGFACSSGTLFTSSFTSESLGHGQSAAEEEYQTPERSADDRWQLALGVPWSLDERSVCRGRELRGSAGFRGNETRFGLARSPLSPSSSSYGIASKPFKSIIPVRFRLLRHRSRCLPFPLSGPPGWFPIPCTTPTTLPRSDSGSDVDSQ
jgi:hypothetical protein